MYQTKGIHYRCLYSYSLWQLHVGIYHTLTKKLMNASFPVSTLDPSRSIQGFMDSVSRNSKNKVKETIWLLKW